jgi:hypothetical protein
MINRLKINLLKVSYGWWAKFSRVWYSATMSLTRMNHELSIVSDVNDIPKLFDYGSKYISDPLGGKLDYLAHPSLLEKRLESGKGFGDCDDHAIYYVSKLKMSGLADRAWFAYYTMCDITGSGLSSHAVCVYEKDGQSYWADYRAPRKIASQWEFANQSAAIYGKKPVAACMFEVEMRERDNPKFISTEVKVDYE